MSLREQFPREFASMEIKYKDSMKNSNLGEALRINNGIYEFIWKEYERLLHENKRGNRKDIATLAGMLSGCASRGYASVWTYDINRDKEGNA